MEGAINPSYFDKIRSFERKLICDALTTTHGNQARAARLLGLSPTTLSSQLRRLGIDARPFRDTGEKISFETFEKLYLWKTGRF